MFGEVVRAGVGIRAAEGALDQTGCGVAVLRALEELGGGEEDAFSFRRRRSSSNVHFQAKSAEVVIDKFHAPFEVVS